MMTNPIVFRKAPLPWAFDGLQWREVQACFELWRAEKDFDQRVMSRSKESVARSRVLLARTAVQVQAPARAGLANHDHGTITTVDSGGAAS